MELQCHVPYEVFKAGETALFRIVGVKSLLNQSDVIIFAQVHGHMQLSEKWVKVANKVLDSTIQEHSMTSLDQVHALPNDPTPSKISLREKASKCVFSTTKIALSPFVLVEEGFLLECEIPIDVIPSYRGRGIQINYYITFYLQSSEKSNTYHFPITINGQGSKLVPYDIKYGGIVAYSLISLPSESLLSSEIGMASGPPASYLSNKSDEKIYKVRDAGHICNVKLGSPHVSVGKELAVHFDFDDCEQSCYAVRVAMLQNEKKLDGSLIQERIVVAATKGSSDAEFLSINLAIPHNICCSWSGPTIKVDYKLVLEFLISESDEPLSFNIPIEIDFSYYQATSKNLNFTKSQLVQISLESTLMTLPILES